MDLATLHPLQYMFDRKERVAGWIPIDEASTYPLVFLCYKIQRFILWKRLKRVAEYDDIRVKVETTNVHAKDLVNEYHLQSCYLVEMMTFVIAWLIASRSIDG